MTAHSSDISGASHSASGLARIWHADVMSIELAQLFVLRHPGSGPESGDLLRLKVRADLSAVLAFGSADAAARCARSNHFEPDIVPMPNAYTEDLRSEPLLVFHSVEEVDRAYADQKSYDFSVHICSWPST